MNVHQLAREVITRVIETDCMPELYGFGLCNLVARHGLPSGYCSFDYAAAKECSKFLPSKMDGAWLPEAGVWTEQRLNALALLACTNPEDFED